MKRRKLLFLLLLLQVCELEFVNSKHHHGSGVKNKRNNRLYNNMIETNKYVGNTNLFKLNEHSLNNGEDFSQTKRCPNCHRTGNNYNSRTENNNMYNKETLENENNLMEKSHKNNENKKLKKHQHTHSRLNQKRNVLMKMTDTMKGYENTAPGQYVPPNQGGYDPNSQGSYGYAPTNGYQQPDPNSYGPAPSAPYVGSQPPGQSPYVPESYPTPGSVPEPGAADYAKPPDTSAPPSDMAVPPQQNPYGYQSGNQPRDQYGMEPANYKPNQYPLPGEEGEDIHDSFKCKYLAMFFDDCKDKPKKHQIQNQPPPPMAPVAQQLCNMYGTSDLNLSDFEPSTNDWLLVNQNNSLRLTSNKPVQSNMQSLELKGNYCNKENFSCTLQLGENSTAGLSVRGMGKQKMLVELNTLTKTVSLKQVNSGTTQVLLENPWPKLNPNFLHLLQVNDGGFQGTLTVLLDGEQVFTKNDLPNPNTGLMGLFITSGNASFGNVSVTPVSS